MRAIRQKLLIAALSLLPEFATPAEAQLSPGDILVADFEAGTNGQGLLFKVDRATGARTVLSDFSNAAQGPTGQSPFGVAVLDTNTVPVVDSQGPGSGAGLLFVVNATTGARTVLSDFSNSAQARWAWNPSASRSAPAGSWSPTTAGSSARGCSFAFTHSPAPGRC